MECQTVWIQIRTDIVGSDLGDWVLTFAKVISRQHKSLLAREELNSFDCMNPVLCNCRRPKWEKGIKNLPPEREDDDEQMPRKVKNIMKSQQKMKSLNKKKLKSQFKNNKHLGNYIYIFFTPYPANIFVPIMLSAFNAFCI